VIVRARVLCVAAALGVSLAACGDKPQTLDASAKKPDAEPWTLSEAATPAFNAAGWKSAGDKAAWEQQIRQRNQAQNDYAR
jgi:hypothetical protein